jgi:hypothetical protein
MHRIENNIKELQRTLLEPLADTIITGLNPEVSLIRAAAHSVSRRTATHGTIQK